MLFGVSPLGSGFIFSATGLNTLKSLAKQVRSCPSRITDGKASMFLCEWWVSASELVLKLESC